MRRQFLLASVGAIVLTGSAFAADLPTRQPPPVYVPPVPIFSWTGLYLGGQVGYAWANDPANVAAATPADEFGPASFDTASFSSRPQGVIGGAHIGYNLQINQWVVGLEGSVDGTSISTSITKSIFAPDFSNILTVGTQASIQGSIRARAGIAWDRAMIYATGGAAFTGIKNNYSVVDLDFEDFATPESISKTRAGWTVGGGIEYAITNNWSVRAEYRYSDFGHYSDYPFVALTVPAGISGWVQHHLTENQAQVGFSYKFGSPAAAPVVAKY
jgi:outer membrane immunogenic protein